MKLDRWDRAARRRYVLESLEVLDAATLERRIDAGLVRVGKLLARPDAASGGRSGSGGDARGRGAGAVASAHTRGRDTVVGASADARIRGGGAGIKSRIPCTGERERGRSVSEADVAIERLDGLVESLKRLGAGDVDTMRMLSALRFELDERRE